MLLTLHDHPDIRMQMSEDLELVGLNENQRAKALRRRKEAEEAAAAKAAKEKKQQVTFKSDEDANGRKGAGEPLRQSFGTRHENFRSVLAVLS